MFPNLFLFRYTGFSFLLAYNRHVDVDVLPKGIFYWLQASVKLTRFRKNEHIIDELFSSRTQGLLDLSGFCP